MNIQIGTAFAYLVKAFLVLSISFTYAQVFWNAFSTPHRKKIHTLSRIDTAFSAIDNILALFNPRMWCWNPVLLSLATLTW